jgi:hypothetical protein
MVPPTPEVQDWIHTSIDTFLRVHSPDGSNGDVSVAEIILFFCLWTRTPIPDVLREFFWVSSRKLRTPEFDDLIRVLKSNDPYDYADAWQRYQTEKLGDGGMSNAEIQRIVIKKVYAPTTNALDRKIKRFVDNLCEQINKRYKGQSEKIPGVERFIPMNKENIKPLLSSYLQSKRLENTILIMKTIYDNKNNKDKSSENNHNND